MFVAVATVAIGEGKCCKSGYSSIASSNHYCIFSVYVDKDVELLYGSSNTNIPCHNDSGSWIYKSDTSNTPISLVDGFNSISFKGSLLVIDFLNSSHEGLYYCGDQYTNNLTVLGKYMIMCAS